MNTENIMCGKLHVTGITSAQKDACAQNGKQNQESFAAGCRKTGDAIRGWLDRFGKGEFLYYAAFALYTIQTFISRTTFEASTGIDIDPARLWMRRIALLLLLLKVVLYQRTTLSRWILCALLAAVGYMTSLGANYYVFFHLVLFIVCAKDVKIKPIAGVSFAVRLVGILWTVILANLGILTIYTTHRGETVRSAMGFVHPNTFAIMMFELCISFCAWHYGKKPVLELLMAVVCAYISLKVPNSRTTFIALCLLAVMIVMFYVVKSETAQRILSLLMALGAAAVVTASMYFMVMYTDTNALMVKLDTLISGRLSYANSYFETYALTAFGFDYSKVDFVFNGILTRTFYVDNAYCNLLLRYGVVAAAIFCLALVLFYIDEIKKRRWSVCLLGMTLFMIVGFSENVTIKFEENFFLIAFAGILFGTPLEDVKRTKRPLNRTHSRHLKAAASHADPGESDQSGTAGGACSAPTEPAGETRPEGRPEGFAPNS